MPRHIARWDLDKTYLRTEFDTLRDIVKTALERPDEKRTNPGASTLLREMVRAGVSVHILSGSPEQMRRRLEDKLRLDGIQWDSFTLKPNLQNLLRLRIRGYSWGRRREMMRRCLRLEKNWHWCRPSTSSRRWSTTLMTLDGLRRRMRSRMSTPWAARRLQR